MIHIMTLLSQIAHTYTCRLDRFTCGEWSSKDVDEVKLISDHFSQYTTLSKVNRTALPETLEGHRVAIKYLHR